MPVPQTRSNLPDPSEPVLHDLQPVRYDGVIVAVRLAVRRSEDGIWRGRLQFVPAGGDPERSTAEIFCATSEQDLWQAVRDLREHHLRDLFRSLVT
ncbi:MAG: hypothetical protein AAB409_05500 [Gemmatimonadota bacterium]